MGETRVVSLRLVEEISSKTGRLFRARNEEDGTSVRLQVAWTEPMFCVSPVVVLVCQVVEKDSCNAFCKYFFVLKHVFSAFVDPSQLVPSALAHWAIYGTPVGRAPASAGATPEKACAVGKWVAANKRADQQYRRLSSLLRRHASPCAESLCAEAVAQAVRCFEAVGHGHLARPFFHNIGRDPVVFETAWYADPRWVEFANNEEVARLRDVLMGRMGVTSLVLLALGRRGVHCAFGEETTCPVWTVAQFQRFRARFVDAWKDSEDLQKAGIQVMVAIEAGERVARANEDNRRTGENVFSMEDESTPVATLLCSLDPKLLWHTKKPDGVHFVRGDTWSTCQHVAQNVPFSDVSWNAKRRGQLRSVHRPVHGVPLADGHVLVVGAALLNVRLQWIALVLRDFPDDTAVVVTDAHFQKVLRDDYGMDSFVAPWVSDRSPQSACATITILLGLEYLGLLEFHRAWTWSRSRPGKVAVVSDILHTTPPPPNVYAAGGTSLYDLVIGKRLPYFRLNPGVQRDDALDIVPFLEGTPPGKAFATAWVQNACAMGPRVHWYETDAATWTPPDHRVGMDAFHSWGPNVLTRVFATDPKQVERVMQQVGCHTFRTGSHIFVPEEQSVPPGIYCVRGFRTVGQSSAPMPLEVPFVLPEVLQAPVPLVEVQVASIGDGTSGWVRSPLVNLGGHTLLSWPEAVTQVSVVLLSPGWTAHALRSIYTRTSRHFVLIGKSNDLETAMEKKSSFSHRSALRYAFPTQAQDRDWF